MFGFLVISILSTISNLQTYGVHKIAKGSAYQSREESDYYVYNEVKNGRFDDHISWEDSDGDKEQSFDGEKIQLANYQQHNKGEYSRRLFEWFSRLFQSTTPKTIQATHTTTESNYQRELKERIFLRTLHRNLTDVLDKLSDVENRVSTAMQQKESYTILTKGKPQVLGLDKHFYYRDRSKRDVSTAEKTEAVTKDSITLEHDRNSNKSTHIAKVNATEGPCDGNVPSGRRTGSSLATPTEVKTKLLLYLQDSFQDIKDKIMSLKNLKQAFSNNVTFKIGYILANIDTLEISMMNLKNNMDKNKEVWEDNTILELYDTLKVSNQAVSGLIDSLKVYLDRLSQQQ